MKYDIKINQFAIIKNGFNIKGTSIETWILLDFLLYFQNAENLKTIIINNQEFIWIKYNYINEQIPLCNFYKQSLTKHLGLLKQIGLIDLHKEPDNTMYFRFTPKVSYLFVTKDEVGKKINDTGKNNQQHLGKKINSTRIYKQKEYINKESINSNVDFEKIQNLSECGNESQNNNEMASNNSIASYKPKDDEIDLNSSAESLGNLESLANSVLKSAATTSDQNQSEQYENTNIAENKLETPQKSKNGNEVIPNYTLTPKIDLKGKSTKQGFNLELAFNSFWSEYPNRKSKPYAKQCFNRCFKGIKDKQALFDTMMVGLEKYKIYIKSRKSDEHFIKHASTWLNQECWNDEYGSPSGNKLTKSKDGKYVADEDFGYDEMKAWLKGDNND